METPTFNDYINLIYNRFDAFIQGSESAKKLGHPYVYEQQGMIVFFMWMQFRRIFKFKTQNRWLLAHPEALIHLKWKVAPHRTTLSRRYKSLYPVLEEFILFLGTDSEALGKELATRHLYEDKSLFKAQGAVWHQSDREQGRIPDKVRQLDTEATWSKSAYHGWVYGYGIHLTCNHAGFPILLAVETASFSEKEALARKEPLIFYILQPQTLCGDDAYTFAKRIREWTQHGIILIAPALRWRKGRYATAYRRFLKQPDIAALWHLRKTAIEPIFDLIAKLLGATGKQKQLAVSRLVNVRPCLALATLSLQIAMIANSIWQLPFRSISTIQGAFA